MTTKPMTESEVLDLMWSSKSEQEWNANCDHIKKLHGGAYPSFWFENIIRSGVLKKVAARWGDDGEMKLTF
jgi:hypothetical protein